MTAQGKAVYETWRAAVPDIACNVPGGPWEDLPATVRAGFEALTPPGHLLVMRGTIALRDAEIELLRKRLADAEYQRDRWIADAASWERRAAERDRFWNALFYIAHRAPDYVPYAGPECVQVAKDAIDGSEQPPAAPELTTPEKP